MTRIPVSGNNQDQVLLRSRRRCCICFGLDGDLSLKRGQIAHLDQNNRNADPDNLAFLCLLHHDQYDGKTSQSKALREGEVKQFRKELYEKIAARLPVEPSPQQHEVPGLKPLRSGHKPKVKSEGWKNAVWPKDKGEYIATSSENIPTFPRRVSGYRSENGKDFWDKPYPSRGTVRIFQGNDWQGLLNFPNTMNGCSSGVFMIRWRSTNPSVLVLSSVRNSRDAAGTTKEGCFGYMSGTNCEQPMFKFGGTRSRDKSTLVDVYYELKFWQAAP